MFIKLQHIQCIIRSRSWRYNFLYTESLNVKCIWKRIRNSFLYRIVLNLTRTYIFYCLWFDVKKFHFDFGLIFVPIDILWYLQSFAKSFHDCFKAVTAINYYGRNFYGLLFNLEIFLAWNIVNFNIRKDLISVSMFSCRFGYLIIWVVCPKSVYVLVIFSKKLLMNRKSKDLWKILAD